MFEIKRGKQEAWGEREAGKEDAKEGGRRPGRDSYPFWRQRGRRPNFGHCVVEMENQSLV